MGVGCSQVVAITRCLQGRHFGRFGIECEKFDTPLKRDYAVFTCFKWENLGELLISIFHTPGTSLSSYLGKWLPLCDWDSTIVGLKSIKAMQDVVWREQGYLTRFDGLLKVWLD